MIDTVDPRIAGAPLPVITCTVNGVAMRLRHGHRITETFNGRTRFDGVIYSPDGATNRPPVGGDIQVVEDGVVTFGGIIDTPTEGGVGGAPVSRLLTPISALDYNALAERRVLWKDFPAGGTLKSWLQIVVPYLAHWGVVLDPAQVDGPVMVDDMAAYFMRLDEVLNEFTTLTNGDYLWEITANKYLRMFAPATTPAPFDVVDGDRNTVGDVTVAPSITTFATRILLLFGAGLHDVTETFLGDGTTASFPLGYWVAASRGYVTANPPGYSGPDVNEPIGATAPPYWTYDNAAATLTRTPAPVAGTAISFTYTAQFPTLVYADPPGGIPDPPGLWERLVREPDVFDKALAQAHANTYILQASTQTTTIKYRTLGRGVHPGQLQNITRAARHLAAQCLITDVGVSDTDGRTYRDVTAVASTIPPGETWRDIIKSWGAPASSGAGSNAQITSGSGGSGGAAIGPGTTGRLAKWITATTLGDSLISESGSTLTVNGDVVATSYTGSGAGLTNLPASALTGTISDARLSANVALKNAPLNAFTGNMTIAGTLGVTGATTLGALTAGATTLASLGVTNNATVGGTLGVTGTTTLGVLNAGAATLASLSVTGNTTLSTLTTTGLANLAGLAVTGAATFAGTIGSPTYSTQLTGWQITAAGNADVRYLYADELHTKAFIADLEQALAGGQIISKSVAKVATTANGGFRVGTDTQLLVESFAGFATASVFQNGDVIRLRSFARTSGNLTITDAYGTVALDTTYGAGGYDAPTMTQAYTFTKTSGANILANTGTLALDYGVSGNGYYEVSAVDGAWAANAPYAQVVTWTGTPATQTCRTRLGNLYGIFTSPGEFGLFAGDYASKRYLRASSAGVELHGLDLLLWDGAINTFKMNHTVPSFAMGNPVPTGYGTGGGTGMWMGKDTDGIYKFRVGTPGSAGMFWDGTSLTITGVSGGALTGIPTGGAANDVNTYSTTISGGKLTTGSVTANKLLITGNGAALNHDPLFVDLTMWTVYQGNRILAATGFGAYAFVSSSPSGSYCQVTANDYISIDRTKTYRVSGAALKDSGNNGLWGIGLIEYDINKTLIQGTRTDFSTVLSASWTTYTITFPAFQPATAFVQVYAILNNGGTTGQQYVANLRLEEILPSTLIMDGAITTNKIAANAITASKIFIGNDAALNDDPACGDVSAWVLTQVGLQQSSYGSPHCLMSAGVGTPTMLSVHRLNVSAGKTYRYHCYGLRSSDANGLFYVGLYYFDYLGNQLTYNYPAAPGVVPPSAAWQTYEGTVSVALGNMPSTTTMVQLLIYLNYNNTAGWMAITDVRFEEMSPSTLIQDGAITTNKLTANAVSAGQINAGAVTAGTIAANAVTAGTVNAGVVTTREIASRTITAGNIATATITANELAAHTITAGQIAAGTITATEIAAGTITAAKLNVSQLSAIAADLGTITAGSLQAVTITASTMYAGGDVLLNSNGITINSGNGAPQSIKMGSTSLFNYGGNFNISTPTAMFGRLDMVSNAIIDVADFTQNSGNTATLGTLIANATTINGILQCPNMNIASGVNVTWAPGPGTLLRASSSRRYKKNIRAWSPRGILDAQPVLFDFIGSGQADVLGFIAEDLHALDPHLVVLDEHGRPEGIHNEAVLAHLLAALQDVTRRLTEIEGHA